VAVHSRVKIYIHLIWGTYKHERILDHDLRLKIYEHIMKKSEESKIIIFKMNIQPEHVHMLISLASDRTIASIAKDIKGESSHWINSNHLAEREIHWQRGYGAYSVSQSQVEAVEDYIKYQDKHHKREPFEEEYKRWADQYGVWDTNEDWH